MSKNSRLVYSTDQGRVKTSDAPAQTGAPSDGIVRIKRETKGRKGKGVSLITGLQLTESELKVLAKSLKQLCGTGGAVKDGIIEIQGDHREVLKTALEKQSYTVKLAGG